MLSDQQRGDALGADGNDEIDTPHLDALAASGTRFARHFVQHPLCMPSRVSLLSSRYPRSLGITSMGVPVPPDVVTLPHLLQRAGHHTANIGKLHFLPHANRDHTLPHPAYGFDHLELAEEPGVYEDAYRAWLRREAPQVEAGLEAGLPPARDAWEELLATADGARLAGKAGGRDDYARLEPWQHDPALTHTAFVGRRTDDLLRRRARDGRPFLCVAGFFSPHAPLTPPPDQLGRYDRAALSLPSYPPELERTRHADQDGRFSDAHLRMVKHGYYALVSEVDDQVGRLVATLDETGLRRDTVVVVLSDHGEWLGDHLRYAKGYPGDDSVSRVPFLLSGPGVPAGRVVTDVVEAVDVVPTLLALLGLPVPTSLEGRSLVPLLGGEAAEPSPGALMEGAGWKTLRTDRHRYLVHADSTESVWDLVEDPGEHDDVASERPELVADLRQRLLTKLLATERALPRTFPY